MHFKITVCTLGTLSAMWPWQKEQWEAFLADMERVLDIYKRLYDKKCPVVCYDEMPRQLLDEV